MLLKEVKEEVKEEVEEDKPDHYWVNRGKFVGACMWYLRPTTNKKAQEEWITLLNTKLERRNRCNSVELKVPAKFWGL